MPEQCSPCIENIRKTVRDDLKTKDLQAGFNIKKRAGQLEEGDGHRYVARHELFDKTFALVCSLYECPGPQVVAAADASSVNILCPMRTIAVDVLNEAVNDEIAQAAIREEENGNGSPHAGRYA